MILNKEGQKQPTQVDHHFLLAAVYEPHLRRPFLNPAYPNFLLECRSALSSQTAPSDRSDRFFVQRDRIVPRAATVTFQQIAYTTRYSISTGAKVIGERSYSQPPELIGYRLFWRYLLQLSQRWVGRCIVPAHRQLSKSGLRSSVPGWARSPLRGGRHGFPDDCRMWEMSPVRRRR